MVSDAERDRNSDLGVSFTSTTSLPATAAVSSSSRSRGGLREREFKVPERPVPRPSLLNLDKLAREKRQEREDKRDRERSRDHDRDRDAELGRKFRERRLDTPSHPGGVDEDVRRSIEQRELARKANRSFQSSSHDRRNPPPFPIDHYPGSKRQRIDERDDQWRAVTPKRELEMERSPLRGSSSHSSTLRAVKHELDSSPFFGRSSSVRRSHEEDEKSFDREFYDAEESSTGVYVEPSAESVSMSEQQERDHAKVQSQQLSGKKSRFTEDTERWEETQMRVAGVTHRQKRQLVAAEETNANNDDEEVDYSELEHDLKVHLIVQDIKPPFLDGRIAFTKQMQPVLPVKDLTSDLAVLSRRGSSMVRELRERKERMKSVQKYWELEGTRMGKTIGLSPSSGPSSDEGGRFTSADGDQGSGDSDATFNHKKSSQYLSHLGSKSISEGERKTRKQRIKEQRESLPIAQCRSSLMQVIRDHNIIVVVGETGSGKTTQLTQYLLEEGYGKARTSVIGCTQPRRVAAVSVAKRVSEELGCTLGEQVGYSIRFEDCTKRDATIIKYMTDGVLLRESLHDDALMQYRVIIMDEAHERSLNTDVLFGILRDVACKRRDLKLIITSATMDSEKFSEFFGGAPIFSIPGRTFEVQCVFSRVNIEDYVEAAVKQTLQIHASQPQGDILIFMTGQEDIEATCSVLAERVENLKTEGMQEMLILPIYSQLPSDMQAKIFQNDPNGVRKCIVATNIAETSLTVDGIVYVVDCGFSKLKVFNPKIGMDALQVFPVSQANANQRKGRAGRTQPGICFRLYTEKSFLQEMLYSSVPEIQRTNLSNVVLLLKSLGVDDLLKFHFMDPPPQENLVNSMYQLWILGALDNSGQLTPLGRKMAEFPLDPPLSKLLIVSSELHCTMEIVTIVSVLSVPTVFFSPKERLEEANSAREKFIVPDSDHLTLLNVYQLWRAHEYSKQWCDKHFILSKAMQKVREVRTQLLEIMEQQSISLVSCGSDWDIVRKCICSAYFQNAARLKGNNEYVNLRTGTPCHIHPTSSLQGHAPDYVVYHELMLTSKEYMRCVTMVDPLWLAELGPMFFTIREASTTRTEQNRMVRQNQSLMELEFQQKIEDDRKRSQESQDNGSSHQSFLESLLRKGPSPSQATPGRRASSTRRIGI